MSQDLHFKTKISGHTQKGHELRGRALTDLIEKADFVATFFLSLTGSMPSKAEHRIMNAILVACIDHGLYPSSGFVPRVIAASGNDVYSSMAGALLALGPRHGGAITGCMHVLQDIKNQKGNVETACTDFVTKARAEKRRIPGLGHPNYTDEDPRAQQLFKIAQQAGLDPEYVIIIQMLEMALEKELGRKLVINIDGAIAALLSTIGLDPLAGNAIFGVSRVAGSIAHIVEENNQKGSVRRIPEEMVEYSS
jgi:citryl-CoA lyase